MVGPGGIGKTRLAIQVGQKLVGTQFKGDNFADGILFVPLASVSAPSGIVSAIAGAANFNFYSNVSPRQQLLDYLREKQMLLVLDNFEHLLEGSDLVSDILSAAPAVKILATSREGLNVQEAWFHPLAGLTFPEVEDPRSENRRSDRAYRGDTTADLSVNQYDAIRLFEQSARRARLDFSLAAEQEHVVRICQLVGGMPLGIELAAAWLKILPAKKIAAEIEHSLDILTTRLQNVPERHRSMRAVFEHSWQRLSAEEGDVLKRLSVFRGSFDQEAAEQTRVPRL